ncbi:MAG: M1 family aminopeptidase [Salibacteraceae bacterium]
MKKIILVIFIIISVSSFSQYANVSEIEAIAKSEMSHALKHSTKRVPVKSDSIDVLFHDAYWTVYPGNGEISGHVITKFKVGPQDISRLYFDLANSLTVDSIIINGNNMAFTRPGNVSIEIVLPNSMSAFSLGSVAIFYHGIPTSAFTTDTHGPQGVAEAWTISEPYGAREWWPCKDQLNDKIDSMNIHITTSLGNKAGSLGLLESIDTVGNDVTYNWKHRYPVTPYLVSLAVTNYVEFTEYVHTGVDSFPIVNYVYPEDLSYASYQVPRIVKFFDLFDSLFIPYPFHKEKYGHAQTSLGGGMEHQTMSTMGSFSDDLMAHELAHQWFGDYTTCASWEELWLNEGFATYLTGLTRERFNLPSSWDDWKRGKINNITSQPNGSVFVTDTTTFWRLFSARLTYDKGSYLLHMLRWKMGDDAFFTGVTNYLLDPNIKMGFATNQDLIMHLEAASNMDLTEFFDDWFYGEGYPSYSITLAGVAPNYSVRISQTTSHSSVDFFEMPVQIRFQGAGLDTLMRFENTENDQWFNFQLNHNIVVASFDPNRWIISRSNQIVLGADELEETKNSPIVYPQPANNTLHITNINSSQDINDIQIYSMTGSKIDVNARFEGRNILLTIEELPSGVYFVNHPKWTKPIRFVK